MVATSANVVISNRLTLFVSIPVNECACVILWSTADNITMLQACRALLDLFV